MNYNIRRHGIPKAAVEQTSQHESHETRQKIELVAHVERYNLVDVGYIAERSGIAVSVHGINDHANDPRQTEQEYHQWYSQPQRPVYKERTILGNLEKIKPSEKSYFSTCF